MQTKVKNEAGDMVDVTVAEDDGIRAEATIEMLTKLNPAFKKGGSTTAGNASQVTDGAGCVLLARRSYAKAKGLPIIGVWRGFSVVGVDPALMARARTLAAPSARNAPAPALASCMAPRVGDSRIAAMRNRAGGGNLFTHTQTCSLTHAEYRIFRRASARPTPFPRRSRPRAWARATSLCTS